MLNKYEKISTTQIYFNFSIKLFLYIFRSWLLKTKGYWQNIDERIGPTLTSKQDGIRCDRVQCS